MEVVVIDALEAVVIVVGEMLLVPVARCVWTHTLVAVSVAAVNRADMTSYRAARVKHVHVR